MLFCATLTDFINTNHTGSWASIDEAIAQTVSGCKKLLLSFCPPIDSSVFIAACCSPETVFVND